MAKKNAAIIKRDLRENWGKSKYIPDENVIILMDNDDGSVSLMIGDGETNVNELPDIINEKPFAKSTVTEKGILIL